MKKMFVLLLSAAFIAAPAFARIPAKINDAFRARYAGASKVEWTHTIGNYKATFYMGDYQLKAKFDKDGRWLGSQKNIGQERLPMMVKKGLHKTKYGRWEIKSTYEKYMPDQQPQYYITAHKGSFQRKTLIFDRHGQLMNG